MDGGSKMSFSFEVGGAGGQSARVLGCWGLGVGAGGWRWGWAWGWRSWGDRWLGGEQLLVDWCKYLGVLVLLLLGLRCAVSQLLLCSPRCPHICACVLHLCHQLPSSLILPDPP